MKAAALILPLGQKTINIHNLATQIQSQPSVQYEAFHAVNHQSSHSLNPENSESRLYRVKTTRQTLKSSDSIIEMSNSGTVRKMSKLNTPAVMSPQTSRAGSKVRSGSRSRVDFAYLTEGLGGKIEQKMIDKKIKQMAIDWSHERNILQDEVRRLEFIVRQWEQLDQKEQSQSKQPKESIIMSETSIAAHVSTGDKEEIEKLKAALKQSETEKDEMMVDLQLMESELKKIKIVPNQTPRFYREENSINYISDSNSSIYANANQGKDIIGASLNQSAISRMKKQNQIELGRIHEYYNKIITHRDYTLEILEKNFQSLQEELEQERNDTMTLLQRRTCELENSMQNLRTANEKTIQDLRCTIDKRNIELGQERHRVNMIQSELNLKNELVESLENQILSLSQTARKHNNSKESSELVNSSFGKYDTYRQLDYMSIQTQTDPNYINHVDKSAQVNMNSPDRTASYKSLHLEMDRLIRKAATLQEIIEEKELVINEMTRASTQPHINMQTNRILEKTCNELVMQNNRLKSLILENNSDRLIQEDMRIRIVSRDVSKCDLSTITNPLVLKEISELRLFKAVASKELQRLKNQLEESLIQSESYYKDQHFQQLQLSSQDRLLRNNYDVTVSNLTNQISTFKNKLQGMQRRYDIKCHELKEKDNFFRNAIGSKIDREANHSDIKLYSRKLNNFMSVSKLRPTSPKN